jgi:Na+/melibiose symporter-like transporter
MTHLSWFLLWTTLSLMLFFLGSTSVLDAQVNTKIELPYCSWTAAMTTAAASRLRCAYMLFYCRTALTRI